MRKLLLTASLALLAAWCVTAGCKSAGPTTRPSEPISSGHSGEDNLNPALVMLPGDAAAISDHTAFTPAHLGDLAFLDAVAGRNDHKLGGQPAWEAGYQVVQIRHRELLRTINGRPREFSTTSTHTLERRIRP